LNAFEFAFQIIHQKWNRFEWSTIANGSLNALVKKQTKNKKKNQQPKVDLNHTVIKLNINSTDLIDLIDLVTK
jgi:hypothetical protein